MNKSIFVLNLNDLYKIIVKLVLFLGLLSTFKLLAQQGKTILPKSNITVIKLESSDSIDISFLSIVEWSTIQIPEISFKIDSAAKKIYFLTPPFIDSLILTYRSSAITFNQPYFKKSLQQIDSNISFGPSLNYNADATAMKGYVKFNALEYSGSYARSLQVGNSQDVTLNSNFNINLNGYILDSVRVEAAITDNTIPFQADGNTYQLQEFDKLYITFEKNKHKLTVGDLNMINPKDNYFLRYNKRVQGLNFHTGFDVNKKVTNEWDFSGSIAKGQFARNIFNGKEGNQGPYKLTGNNGEIAFVVLAGTEKIYIDGRLLQRGQDRDYIINYNTGEVTFMPRQMITKDKRIQVEFEYQDRNYLNSLFHINDQVKVGERLHFNFNFYSNQDAKNQPYLQNIGNEERSFLGSIGDSIQRAFYNTRVVDTFKEKEILYRIKDTAVNGVLFDSIYEYSINNDSVLYALNFTNLGENKGNYVISDKNVNGRVYQWVAPLNGIPQGSYEPVLLLITPKKHQVMSAGMVYDIDTFNQLKVEVAASNYDPNLYATNAASNHWGNAVRMDYTNTITLSKLDTHKQSKRYLKNLLYFERVSNSFKTIAPYRNIEFVRDWSVDTTVKANDLLVGYKALLQWNSAFKMNYDFDYYNRTNQLTGQRHILGSAYTYKGFFMSAVANITRSENMLTKTIFWRPTVTIEQKIKSLGSSIVGINYSKEQKLVHFEENKSLSDSSFNFDLLTVYWRNSETSKNKYDFNYRVRWDDSLFTVDQLQRSNVAQEFNGNLTILQIKNQVFNITGTYRNLLVERSRGELKSTDAIVSRLEYNGSLFKKLITTSTIYEIGTGQEQKREYTYIEVDAGLGTYMWVDYNNDGIQQVNEFEIAIYDDQKRFIRVINSTNEYVNVNYMSLNHSIQLQPEQFFKGHKEFKFISRFSDQFTVQLNNRAFQEEGLSVYNPFSTAQLNEQNIIAANSSITNVLAFNRANPRFGADYTIQKFLGKTLMTYGIEQQGQQRHILKSRFGITKSITFNANGILGNRFYKSGLVDDRSYDIQIRAIEPTLTWLLQSKLRITGIYKFETRSNSINFGGEIATIHHLGTELKWSLRKSGTINLKMTYAQIDYNGLPNTSKTFAILESLKNGNNWLWFSNWDVRIGKNLELSLNYEGRKTGTDRVIHTGNMSIRALLN